MVLNPENVIILKESFKGQRIVVLMSGNQAFAGRLIKGDTEQFPVAGTVHGYPFANQLIIFAKSIATEHNERDTDPGENLHATTHGIPPLNTPTHGHCRRLDQAILQPRFHSSTKLSVLRSRSTLLTVV